MAMDKRLKESFEWVIRNAPENVADDIQNLVIGYTSSAQRSKNLSTLSLLLHDSLQKALNGVDAIDQEKMTPLEVKMVIKKDVLEVAKEADNVARNIEVEKLLRKAVEDTNRKEEDGDGPDSESSPL